MVPRRITSSSAIASVSWPRPANATTISAIGITTPLSVARAGPAWQSPAVSPTPQADTEIAPQPISSRRSREPAPRMVTITTMPTARAAAPAAMKMPTQGRGVEAPKIAVGGETSTQPTNHSANAITRASSRCRPAIRRVPAAQGSRSRPAHITAALTAVPMPMPIAKLVRAAWWCDHCSAKVSTPTRAIAVVRAARALPIASMRWAWRAAPTRARAEETSRTVTTAAAKVPAAAANAAPVPKCTHQLCRIETTHGGLCVRRTSSWLVAHTPAYGANHAPFCPA